LQEDVRIVHALGDKAASFAWRDARPSASDERGGQLEERGSVLPVLGQSLRPGDDALTHGMRQTPSLELSFLAEADNDDRLGARQEAAPFEVRARIDEDLVRADQKRIVANRERMPHRA